MLEIGTGTGWFPILCRLNGLSCKGLEISPQLVACARRIGDSHGIDAGIELGNIEQADLGHEQADVIIANFVFEHVQDWRQALRRVYDALKPDGVLVFQSTNKFSVISGEFAKMPFYGWLPNPIRYRVRMLFHGRDIMKLGIDFNQFTYLGLRKAFREIGFRRMLDRVDLADRSSIKSRFKREVLRVCDRSRFVRETALLFFEVTTFVCVK
jgi:SAM-dependent methyltransferase